ncbi:MAG: DUF2628 domain-containing protein [Clostridia bacterium]|nr:DUF2628 domain-containing protein [Clostridia bacterium]
MEKTIICQFCGAECSNQDIYCPKCLKRIPEELHDPDSMIDNMGEHRVFAFVEKNTEHYLKAFKRGNNKKIFPSFNWSAFFFNVYWMVYRKMYVEALVTYLISRVVSLACGLLIVLPHKDEIIRLAENAVSFYSHYEWTQGLNAIKADILWKSCLCSILSMLVFGVFGNAIYKGYVKRNIHDLNKGGTLIWPIFVAFMVAIGIDAILDPIIQGIAQLFIQL